MSLPPVVRAIDVGYGHVKFSTGFIDNVIEISSFPSQSPIASQSIIETTIMQRRDTFLIPCANRVYEVGKDVAMAMSANEESEVLDQNFAFSDAYRIRLYGAFNYMLKSLPQPAVIDSLVLGLPLNTFFKREKEVSAMFTGTHTINTKGDTIKICNVHTFPQPIGSFAEFLKTRKRGSIAETLIIDTGYKTVDFFICSGMMANEKLSGALNRGVGAVLRAAALAHIKRTNSDSSPSQIVRIADRALSTGVPFKMFGKPIDLTEFLTHGQAVIDEAVHAIKNFVNLAETIDVVVLSGGGAQIYAETIRASFPDHEVVILENSNQANVRGFHRLGERMAQSALRAKATT